MVCKIKWRITAQPLPITINADCKTYSQAIDRLKTTEGIVEELESKLNQCQKRQTIKKKQTVKFKFFLQTLFNNNLVRKLPLLVPLIIIAVAIGAIGLAFVPSGIKNKRLDFAQGTAMINGNLIKVEIAKSAAEKQRWLMFRQERLPLNSAMMLIYDKLDLYAMWLLNIDFNLDLLFLLFFTTCKHKY